MSLSLCFACLVVPCRRSFWWVLYPSYIPPALALEGVGMSPKANTGFCFAWPLVCLFSCRLVIVVSLRSCSRWFVVIRFSSSLIVGPWGVVLALFRRVPVLWFFLCLCPLVLVLGCVSPVGSYSSCRSVWLCAGVADALRRCSGSVDPWAGGASIGSRSVLLSRSGALFSVLLESPFPKYSEFFRMRGEVSHSPPSRRFPPVRAPVLFLAPHRLPRSVVHCFRSGTLLPLRRGCSCPSRFPFVV